MTGCDSIGTKPTKARRWVLRSPGRKPTPTTTLGEQENLPANIAKPPPRGPSVSPREQAQQSQAQAKETSPSNAVLQAWNREHDSQKTTGAPRADKCLDTTTSDAGEASARPSDPLAGKAQGPSPFRLSRLRNKMLVPSAGLLKRFRRRSPNEVRGSYTIVEAREQRSPKGRATASCSIDTTAQDVELAYHSGGGGGSTPNDTWTSPVAEDGCLGEELVGEPCTASTAKAQSTQSHSSAQQHHATSDTGCRSINDLLAEGQHSETAIEREASRAHPSLGVGEDAISAIKTGKQPPRIAFIGVFLNGVAVALASFAPFGEVDARKALVKAVRMYFLWNIETASTCREKQQSVWSTPGGSATKFCPSSGPTATFLYEKKNARGFFSCESAWILTRFYPPMRAPAVGQNRGKTMSFECFWVGGSQTKTTRTRSIITHVAPDCSGCCTTNGL